MLDPGSRAGGAPSATLPSERSARDGPLDGPEVLVVGAGRMGRLLARAAHGARRVGRHRQPVGGRARRSRPGPALRTTAFDPGADAGRFDAIVVALAGPWTIAGRHDRGRPRAPRPSSSTCRSRRPSRRRSLRDSATRSSPPTTSRSARRRTRPDAVPDAAHRALSTDTVREFHDWQARGDARAAADALVRRADHEREAELAALWRKLPALDPEAREAIEGMTRHLAARLLRQPLERLGRDADGATDASVRDLFAL